MQPDGFLATRSVSQGQNMNDGKTDWLRVQFARVSSDGERLYFGDVFFFLSQLVPIGFSFCSSVLDLVNRIEDEQFNVEQ